MKRLHVKFIKWLSNKFGYKIAMLKTEVGMIDISGNAELLKYVDVNGYLFNKEPIRREYVQTHDEVKHINKLTKEQLKDIGLL